MKINQIQIAKLRIPLIRPFITALRRTEHVEDIVVILSTYNLCMVMAQLASTPVGYWRFARVNYWCFADFSNRFIGQRIVLILKSCFLLIQTSLE